MNTITAVVPFAWVIFLCLFAVPSFAQSYPTRPIRFIVPFPPGGGADLVARTVAERLSKAVGQQVIVDNRPGGGTVIGAQLAAHAVPDGYTLFLGTPTTHAINMSLVKDLPYDPVKDFAPVSLIAILHNVMVMHPQVPAHSLRELVALARKRPGQIMFASTGNGSPNHLVAEMLRNVANVDIVHVPYKGAAPALTDLLAGHVHFMFSTIPPALPHVKSGRLKALAVANYQRSALLPEVPTTGEAGAPGVEASSWSGVLVPAGTSPNVIARLQSDIAAIMKRPDMRERLASAGVEPLYSTPEQFKRFMQEETARYAQVVKSSGAKVE